MTNARRLLASLPLIVATLVILAVPVLAAAYSATLTVFSTATSDIANVGVTVPAANKWMSQNGFMLSSALDTRITKGGVNIPRMVADSRANTALDVPAASQTTLYYTTGNSALTEYENESSAADSDVLVMASLSMQSYQTFTPSVTHTVTSLRLSIGRTFNATAATTVSVRAAALGKPSGGALASGTIAASSIPQGLVNPQWVTVSLGSGYRVTSGTQYSIVVVGPATGIIYWFSTATGGYSGGTAGTSTDNGATWTVGTTDNLFQEWGPAAMSIIPGYGGYVTTNDAAALELGSDYAVEIGNTYWDTAGTNVAPAMSKKVAGAANDESFRIAPAPDGAIVAQNYGTVVNTIAQNLVAGAGVIVGGATWLAQTFTPAGADIRVASVSITSIATTLNPGDMVVSIRAVSGGDPVGPDLASVTETQANVVVGGWSTFHLPPIKLVNGTQYALLVRATGGNPATDYYVWRDDNTNPYFFGAQKTSADSGVTWTTTAGNDFTFRINEVADAVVATGISSGAHTVKATQNGTGGVTVMALYVDNMTTAAASITPATSAVPGNAANWTWLPTNSSLRSMGYLGSVRTTITGTLVLEYSPVDMIHGVAYSTGTAAFANGSVTVIGTATAWDQTMVGAAVKYNADNSWHTVSAVTDTTHLTLTAAYSGAGGAAAAYTMAPRLPDTVGTDEMGVITWGSNPAGVTVSLGSMTGAASSAIVSPGVTTTPDILPEVAVSDWFLDPAVSGSLLTNPIRPLVTMMSDSTTINESEAWRLLGLVFVAGVTVATARSVKNHHLITGIAAAGAIIALVVSTIWPMWSLVFTVVAIIGGLVAERSPSL